MAKLSTFKNPVAAREGSVLDLSNWIGGVMWVVMVGMIIALGVKALEKLDKVIPGNQTPNIAPYKTETVAAGPQITVY